MFLFCMHKFAQIKQNKFILITWGVPTSQFEFRQSGGVKKKVGQKRECVFEKP